MKHGLFAPTHLVDLKRLDGLDRLEVSNTGATLGAGVRITRLRDDPAIRRNYPGLAQAARAVASPPLQNLGTLGGNVCLDTRCWYYNQSAFWRQSRGYCLKRGGKICQVAPQSKRCFAVFSGDTVPALIALGARVSLTRWDGSGLSERTVDLGELYVEEGIRRWNLAAGEIVTAVHLPPSRDVRSGYRKYRKRGSIDYPLAGVAVALRVDGKKLRDVRIALGALASAPVLAENAMEVLEGAEPTAEVIARAAELAAKAARPVKNQAGTPGHRRLMARVMCRRLLEEMAGNTNRGK
jgi:4-hydroxybenzoyl-CoA reductase subunit beta